MAQKGFTTDDNFDLDGYLKSQEKVEKFIGLFNKKFADINFVAKSLDGKNRFGADILVEKNLVPYKYIELESGNADYKEVKIYSRRLKKSYNLPTVFIRHNLITNECIVIDFAELKEMCKTAKTITNTRTTQNGTFDEVIYLLPCGVFKVFSLTVIEF